MRRLIVASSMLCVVLAAGCGSSSPASSDEPTTAPSATASSESSAEPTFKPAAEPIGSRPLSTPTQKPVGANAAPGGGTTGVYDASQPAYQNFINWVAYEFQDPADGQRASDAVYTEGVSVCASRALGELPDSIARKLAANNGYSGTAAAAIVKAALSALCPNRNPGYVTYFDRNAQTFYTRIVTERRITYSQFVPNVFDFGYYMKDVCNYVQAYGGTAVRRSTTTSQPGRPISTI